MISNLTSAWQASAQADSDLSKWADDEAGGCKKGKTGTDANYRASLGPDATATSSKEAFVAEWNPLAQKLSLQTYTIGEPILMGWSFEGAPPERILMGEWVIEAWVGNQKVASKRFTVVRP